MAKRVVIADASSLIGLASADAFDCLRGLFGEVVITSDVRDEVLAAPALPGASEAARAIEDGWLLVARVAEIDESLAGLGPGEASVIALALSQAGPCLVVLDDAAARNRARDAGLAVVGVLGVLLAAKRAGIIDRLEPRVRRLLERGFHITPGLVAGVLREAGEEWPGS